MQEYYVEMFRHRHFVYATDIYDAIKKIARRYTAKIPVWWVKIRAARDGETPHVEKIRQVDGKIEIESEWLWGEEEERRRRAALKRRKFGHSSVLTGLASLIFVLGAMYLVRRWNRS